MNPLRGHKINILARFSLPKGFTLIELMVSVVVLAILSGVVMNVLNPKGVRNKSEDATKRSNLEKLYTGIEAYRHAEGVYPTCSGTCTDLSSLDTSVARYIQAWPSEPTGATYNYVNEGVSGICAYVALSSGTTKYYEYTTSTGKITIVTTLTCAGSIPTPTPTPTPIPTPPPWACGNPLTINHVAGNVAPVTKTVSYGTVSTNIGGTGTKCWITKNLGASSQASSGTDSSEAAAGWYWQFNRKQGYQYTASRTPNTAWITNIDESNNWSTANDPCTLLLGAGWRLPTDVEWTNADGSWNNYNDTYASVLKLHAAGWLLDWGGSLTDRGVSGIYWSSESFSSTSTLSYDLYFGINYSAWHLWVKASGEPIRCLKD